MAMSAIALPQQLLPAFIMWRIMMLAMMLRLRSPRPRRSGSTRSKLRKARRYAEMTENLVRRLRL
jgi:hypothetical protein